MAAIFTAAASLSLTACGLEAAETPGSGVENGVAAIEDAMTKSSESSTVNSAPIDDLRGGSSADTVATPDDFPVEYQYGRPLLPPVPAAV